MLCVCQSICSWAVCCSLSCWGVCPLQDSSSALLWGLYSAFFFFRFTVRIPMLHGYLSFLIVPIRHPGFFFLPLLCFAGFFPRVPLRASVRKEPACVGDRQRIIVSDCITLTPGTITLEESASEYTILCMNDDGGDHSRCFEERLTGKGGKT